MSDEPIDTRSGAERKATEGWVKANCGPHEYGVEDENGVDLSLIRANLELTADERIAQSECALANILWLKKHARVQTFCVDMSIMQFFSASTPPQADATRRKMRRVALDYVRHHRKALRTNWRRGGHSVYSAIFRALAIEAIESSRWNSAKT